MSSWMPSAKNAFSLSALKFSNGKNCDTFLGNRLFDRGTARVVDDKRRDHGEEKHGAANEVAASNRRGVFLPRTS